MATITNTPVIIGTCGDCNRSVTTTDRKKWVKSVNGNYKHRSCFDKGKFRYCTNYTNGVRCSYIWRSLRAGEFYPSDWTEVAGEERAEFCADCCAQIDSWFRENTKTRNKDLFQCLAEGQKL